MHSVADDEIQYRNVCVGILCNQNVVCIYCRHNAVHNTVYKLYMEILLFYVINIASQNRHWNLNIPTTAQWKVIFMHLFLWSCTMHYCKPAVSSECISSSAEHFRYASKRLLAVLLSPYFNAMMIHSHVPKTFSGSVLVSIIKVKKGDITDIDNYRPIAITYVASQVCE